MGFLFFVKVENVFQKQFDRLVHIFDCSGRLFDGKGVCMTKKLSIVTLTDKNNFDFFDKKILGLSSIEWIVSRVGKYFDVISFADDWGDEKDTSYVSWDNTLVDKHSLPFCHSGVRLCGNTFAYIEERLQSIVVDELVQKGVVFHGRQGLHIDKTVQIERGVEIFAPNVLVGNTFVSAGTVIYSYCFLNDCKIGKNCNVGPFATLRQNSMVGDCCRVGNFVEIKNSVLGDKTKTAHHAYVGDAMIGENTNVGCGVVFANFDGKAKHKTQIGKNCFLGCNTNLVAPLKIGDGCFVAAGTTVTKDVEDNTFVIGRSRQQNREK